MRSLAHRRDDRRRRGRRSWEKETIEARQQTVWRAASPSHKEEGQKYVACWLARAPSR